MKKIVHVVHSLQAGGLENGLVNLLNRLDPERFQQTVCCLTTKGTFAERIEAPTVKIVELHQSADQFRFPLFRLSKVLRQLNPDIVHTRGWSAIDAVFAAKLARVPCLVHGEHGREHSDAEGLNWKRNNVRRLVGHLVDRYVVVSDFFRPWLKARCGVDERKIIYIPNGVDTKKFYPESFNEDVFNGSESAAQKKCELRTRKGLPIDGVIIGSVARLDPVKDFPTLLKAFRIVVSEISNAKLAIVGNGPVWSSLRNLSEELKIHPSVLWLGERSDIPELLRCFDIFAQTSIFEGMSNTVLEAMASGLPIVATKTGGNPDLVKDGTNGALIEVGDIEALAIRLTHLVRNQPLLDEFGRKSRCLALSQFDLSVMANRYADLYASLD